VTVYLLRHGIADERRPDRPDEKRALTEDGRKKLRLVLARARAAGVGPSLILTSPYVRAVQTAEVAAEALGYKGSIVRIDALTPGSSPEAVWREIRDRTGEAAILLAGHEPLLGQTAGYLLGTPALAIDLKKGALLRLDVDESARQPRGVLEWLLTAKLAAI
jgi:phosphohistidine phosphatase